VMPAKLTLKSGFRLVALSWVAVAIAV
jgi:hypothetical protein